MTTKADLKSSVYWRNQKGQAVTNEGMYPTADDLVTLVEMSTQRSGSELRARNPADTAYVNFHADTITADSGFVGNIAGNVSTPLEVIVGTDTSTGYGLLTTTFVTAKVVAAGGATENIAVQIPSGAKIIACQIRNDSLVVLGGGGTTLAYAYNTGATQSIGSGKALTANTKVNTFFDVNAATCITSGLTDITVTPSAGTITSGTISAVVYYQMLTSITSL